MKPINSCGTSVVLGLFQWIFKDGATQNTLFV